MKKVFRKHDRNGIRNSSGTLLSSSKISSVIVSNVFRASSKCDFSLEFAKELNKSLADESRLDDLLDAIIFAEQEVLVSSRIFEYFFDY